MSEQQRRDDTPPSPPPSGDGQAVCAAASECAVVFTGPRCACDCDAVAAMHRSRVEAYEASRPTTKCDWVCGACAAREVKCEQGRCALAD